MVNFSPLAFAYRNFYSEMLSYTPVGLFFFLLSVTLGGRVNDAPSPFSTTKQLDNSGNAQSKSLGGGGHRFHFV